MKQFLFIYRSTPPETLPSPEQMQDNMSKWMDWLGSLAAQNKLIDKGNRLTYEGKVLKPDNVVTDGPYAEIKEIIGGYSLIKADDYDEAVELAKGCPIYNVGGSLEVREIFVPEQM